MFEELLEDIAQTNGLCEVNTYLKLAAGLGAILLCLLSTGFIAPLFIAVLLAGGVLLLARIDPRTYAALFIVPCTFAVTGIIVIVLLSGGDGIYWQWAPLPWLSVSVTRDSINEGFFIFCRVIGGMSALLFIALTTPMTDLFPVMRRARIPEAVVDLAMIIYRSIFSILDQLVQTHQAQVMRLGYSTFRESVRSLGTLCGAVFIASWNAGEDFIRAMEARCYAGKFASLGENRPVEAGPLLTVAGFLVLSAVVVLTTRNATLL